MNKMQALTVIIVSVVIFANLVTQTSFADTTPTRGVISIAFDDGFQNPYSYAYPILQSKGIPASFYVITNWINTRNQYGTYMTTAELIDLQNNGNEIGSHSVDHVSFNSLDEKTMRYEYSTSKATLESWGINVVGFAYPNGKTRNAWTDSIGLEYYQYVRSGYQEPSVMTLPWTQQPVTAIQGDWSHFYDLAVMKAAVDRVAASNGWTVVCFHDVSDNQGHWLNHIGTDDFTAFLDYIQAKGVATMTVAQALHLNAPHVTISPTSATIAINQSKTFTSSVFGGTAPYSYQWYLNDTAISGTTNENWTFTPTIAGNYKVYLNVTDAFNLKVQSNIVTSITVYSQLTASISPVSFNTSVGTPQIFISTVSGGAQPYTYKWYLNGTQIPNANVSTLIFTPTSAGNFIIYLTVADNDTASLQSNNATITAETPTNVNITPTQARINLGQSQTFNSTVSGGTTPYSYQWYLNDTAILDATNQNWAFTPTTPGHYRIYLNITDALNIKTQSNIVTDITVYPQLTVSINPTTVNMTVGMTQTFNSTILGGTQPYTYQWVLNGTAVSGANSSTWNFTPTQTGHYSVYLNVVDSLNSQTQSNIVSDIFVYLQLSVSISPTSTNIALGGSQQFNSTVIGGVQPYTYQWVLNGTAVSGATNAIWNFTPTQIGYYNLYVNVTDTLNNQTQSNTVTDILVYSQLYLTINLQSGGSGYTTPAIIITGGGGTGASAKARVSNSVIIGIVLTNPGSGYTSAPTVIIKDLSPRAKGATAAAILTIS